MRCSPGFRPRPTRATTRVAPTALFWDVCRGDPCGRPLFSASANAKQEGRAGTPSKAPLQGELAAKPSEGSPPHPGFPTMSNPRAVGDAGPYGRSPEHCREMKNLFLHMPQAYFTREAYFTLRSNISLVPQGTNFTVQRKQPRCFCYTIYSPVISPPVMKLS